MSEPTNVLNTKKWKKKFSKKMSKLMRISVCLMLLSPICLPYDNAHLQKAEAETIESKVLVNLTDKFNYNWSGTYTDYYSWGGNSSKVEVLNNNTGQPIIKMTAIFSPEIYNDGRKRSFTNIDGGLDYFISKIYLRLSSGEYIYGKVTNRNNSERKIEVEFILPDYLKGKNLKITNVGSVYNTGNGDQYNDGGFILRGFYAYTGEYMTGIFESVSYYPKESIDIKDSWFNANPITILSAPTNNLSLSENSVLKVEGAVQDTDAGDTVTVKYSIDSLAEHQGKVIKTYTSNGTQQNYAYDIPIDATIPEGTHTLKIWAEDDKGGKSSEQTRTFVVDNTAPSEPTIGGITGDWQQSPAFTIQGSTDNLSKLKYLYSTDEGKTWIEGSLNNGSTPLTGNAPLNQATMIQAKAVDELGHESAVVTKEIKVDQEKPSISFTPNGHDWTTGEVKATIQYADSLSGLNERQFKVTDNTTRPTEWDNATSNSQEVTVKGEGYHYLHVRATDKAGNEEYSVSKVYQLQNLPVAPTGFKVGPVKENEATFTWNLLTDGFLDGYEYLLENQTLGTLQNINLTTNTYTESSLEGGKEYTFLLKMKNHVGTSDPMVLKVLTLPKKPENVKGAAVGTSGTVATFTWDKVESATKYHAVIKEGSTTVFENNVQENEITLDKLKNNMKYDVSVSAINPTGEGQVQTASYLTLPEKVVVTKEDTKSIVTSDKVNLEWKAVSCDGYNIYANGKLIKTVPTNQVSLEDLSSSTEYQIEVAPFNATGEGEKTEIGTFETKPSDTFHQGIESVLGDRITYKWVRSGNDEMVVEFNGKEMFRGKDNYYTLRDLQDLTEYTIKIWSENSKGEKSTIQTITQKTKLKEPKKVSVAKVEKDKITLDLSETGLERGNGLAIERNGVEIGKVPLTDKTFVDKNLSPAMKYEYSIRNTSDEGDSAPVKVEVVTLTKPVENPKIEPSEGNEIILNWSLVEGAKEYAIYDGDKLIKKVAAPPLKLEELQTSTKYDKIKVVALNEEGKESEAVVFPAFETKPSNTLNPHLLKKTTDSMIIDWDKTGNDVIVIEVGGKEVYRGKQSPYELKDLKENTEYEVKVWAENSKGDKGKVFTDKWKTVKKEVPVSSGSHSDENVIPKPPVFTEKENVVDKSDKQVAFVFSKEASDQIAYYNLDRDKQNIYKGKDSKFTDTKVKPGKTYYYELSLQYKSGRKSIPVGMKVTIPKNGNIPFVDISDNYWAFNEIENLAEKGVIKGYEDSTYRPEAKLQRQHVAVMLSRMLDLNQQEQAEVHYKDVSPDHPYYKEIAQVTQAKIFEGDGGYFHPNADLTRAQMAKILVKAFHLKGNVDFQFPDVPKDHWANEFINTLYSNKITEGSNGKYKPNDSMTRAQYAVFLDRAFNYQDKKIYKNIDKIK